MKNKNQHLKSFTLIEIIVAIAAFSIVVVAITGVFVNSIKGQQKIKDLQNVQDEIRYVLEFMSREIRMADKDGGWVGPNSNGNCLNNDDAVYEISNPDPDELKFLKTDSAGNSECITYKQEDDKIKRVSCFICDTNDDEVVEIISSAIEIQNLEFIQTNGDDTLTKQPRLTIFVKVKAKDSINSVNIQTTVSSRIP